MSNTPNRDLPPIELDVHTVKAMLDAKAPFLLIDCREPSERQTAKIEGSVHIPMKETPQRLHELEPYRNGPIVVHCHHGGRSLRVTQFLRENGFQNAQNMSGGIDEWTLKIDPSVPRY